MGSELDVPWDEAWARPGVPRPQYAALLEALREVDLESLSQAVAESLLRDGATFGEAAFVVDPVPRVLTGAEWDGLELGLAQRARALNRFLLDVYGEQRIVAAGVMPRSAIETAEGFEPDLVRRLPPHPWPAAIIGFDVVRDPQGTFYVLEDNLRTPSGFAYAAAARAASMAQLPTGVPKPRAIEPQLWEALAETLRGAAPDDVGDPRVVVLTDGVDNVAYFEHATAAQRLGAKLVTPSDLTRTNGALLADGELVDVVYRRTNEDRVRDDNGRLTAVAELLLEPWLGGQVGLVNGFGNGVADDKLIHGHVEDFIRFYLQEEPLMLSVPTVAVASDLESAVGKLESHVVKPRHSHGGHGVVIGPLAEAEDLFALAGELREDPEGYVVQPMVTLSVVPTIVHGQMVPRHVDLRPFSFGGPSGVSLLPGGLSRVAFEAGELMVNSSQSGGGKDTWVLPD